MGKEFQGLAEKVNTGYASIGKEVTMSVAELALLAELLSRFFAVCDDSMKGMVETVFFEVWKTGQKHISVLEFHRTMKKVARHINLSVTTGENEGKGTRSS